MPGRSVNLYHRSPAVPQAETVVRTVMASRFRPWNTASARYRYTRGHIVVSNDERVSTAVELVAVDGCRDAVLVKPRVACGRSPVMAMMSFGIQQDQTNRSHRRVSYVLVATTRTRPCSAYEAPSCPSGRFRYGTYGYPLTSISYRSRLKVHYTRTAAANVAAHRVRHPPGDIIKLSRLRFAIYVGFSQEGVTYRTGRAGDNGVKRDFTLSIGPIVGGGADSTLPHVVRSAVSSGNSLLCA